MMNNNMNQNNRKSSFACIFDTIIYMYVGVHSAHITQIMRIEIIPYYYCITNIIINTYIKYNNNSRCYM